MTRQPKTAGPDDVVKAILKGNDDHQVVVSPMVWTTENDARKWYFTVSVSRSGEWFSIRIDDPDYEPPAKLDPAFAAMFDTVIEISPVDARSRIISALLTHKPIVVHHFDDELDCTRTCERLWPGARITKVRKAIEMERVQWAQAEC
jgi:hypothetical protein